MYIKRFGLKFGLFPMVLLVLGMARAELESGLYELGLTHFGVFWILQ